MNQTNKFTGIELCVVLAVVGIVVAIIASVVSIKEETRYKTPPPGWEIVTDGNGNWGAMESSSGFVLEESYSDGPLKSAQEAIDRAWGFHDYTQKKLKEAARKGPEPVREWRKP